MTRFATRSVLAVALALATAAGAAAQDNYETTEIADGVYQFRWIAHNAMFVTTEAGVVVFDTISVDAARQLAAEIRPHGAGLAPRRHRLQPQRRRPRHRRPPP